MERPVEMPGNLGWLYDRIEALGYISLSDFAKRNELHKGNIYRYFSFETKPSIAVVPSLCAALDITPNELLTQLGVQLDSVKSKAKKVETQAS